MSKISNEQQAAYYQYSKTNGVSQEEAAKACDYARTSGKNPKDVTPRSQMSSSSSSSCSSSSKNSSIFKTSSADKKNVNPNDIVRTGNADQDAKNLAKKMGISYKDAQEILKNLFGSPKQTESTTNDTDTTTGNNNMLTIILNLLQNLMSTQQ